MKTILAGFLLLGSLSASAKDLTCKGKSFLNNYDVLFVDLNSDLSAANLIILNRKNGETILGPEHVYTKLPSSQENVLNIVSTENVPSPIVGKINLITQKGHLHISGFGLTKYLKLTGCQLYKNQK